MITDREVIGLIPAAGRASRVAPLPCSKELFPVGFCQIGEERTPRPKVVGHYLLENMRRANITKAYIILREGKEDIPSYFADGEIVDMHLAYLMLDLSFGVPYTLNQAFPFIKEATVALGFPDMIFYPEEAFVTLLAKQKESHADLVLGLFPALHPHKTDMVEVDENGRIRSITIKPAQTQLAFAWEIAVWTPLFSGFMHEYILSRQGRVNKDNVGSNPNEPQNELHVGDVIQAALQSNMVVDAVTFQDGDCLDIGTPEDMLNALQSPFKR